MSADNLSRILQNLIESSQLGRRGGRTRVVNRFINVQEDIVIEEVTATDDITGDAWGADADAAKLGEFIWN